MAVGRRPGALRFEVRAKPRASRSSVEGLREGALLASLAAPPVDGAANEALVVLLADVLRLRRSDVELVLGAGSRHKVVEVRGLELEELGRRLALRVEAR